jgi:hypothetical protein
MARKARVKIPEAAASRLLAGETITIRLPGKDISELEIVVFRDTAGPSSSKEVLREIFGDLFA